MTSEIEEFRSSLVAAVQAELRRHASAVAAEVDRLREEGNRERTALGAEINGKLHALAQLVEQMQARNDHEVAALRTALETRMSDSETRQSRRLDDVSTGIESLVQAAARPMMQEVRDQQQALAYKVDGLDQNLRRFDEQAARMVTYFNDVSQQMEQRQDDLSVALKNDVTVRLDGIQKLVEENDSAIRRFQGEVASSVSAKVNDAEDRFNNRLLATESRIKEESGQKIAEIDLHVSRVATGLDETLTVVTDRIAAIDTRFVATDRRMDEMAESVKGVDQTAIDELKDKMSTAVGEAMLVRIEMERLEKGVAERTDGLQIRMTDVETQLQDATMDVSTAVQMDRLEEIERALIELDPDQFVRKGGTSSGKVDKTLKMPPPPADAVPDGAVAPGDGR